MDKLVNQIGELLLGSIPTIVLFLLTCAMYNFIVHRKLMAVLGERRARTEGAVEKAKRDIAAAETKAAEYDERIRQAYQERKSVPWLRPAPLREALVALALNCERYQPFRRQPSPTTTTTNGP